jgi:hypothetical protein
MSILGCKRLAIALGILSVGLVVLCSCLFLSDGLLRIRVKLASEQTQIFEQMRKQAIQSDAVGAANCLEYIVNYYPSGTKQQTGSELDQMVERERNLAERDIVAYLRTKTGQDLGASPEPWIQKYAQR